MGAPDFFRIKDLNTWANFSLKTFSRKPTELALKAVVMSNYFVQHKWIQQFYHLKKVILKDI